MDRQRPRSREKHVSGPAKTVNKRGDGLGTGPVGVPRNQRGEEGQSSGTRSSGQRSVGGFKLIILLAVLLLGGGGGGLMALLGGSPDRWGRPKAARAG